MKNDFLKLLKNRVAVSSIVQRKVQLRRSGSKLIGLCPFHEERTPSFFVDDSKQYYHCFGCGEHGDIFEFFSRTEGTNFVDTVRQIANIAGIEVPATERIDYDKHKIQNVNSINKKAALWFKEVGKQNQFIRDYFKKRNIDDCDCDKFLLGYVPSDCSKLILGLSKEFSQDLLIKSGLLNKDLECRFRNRIMFPIINEIGLFVGFGSRSVVEVGYGAKYINTAEGEFFKKGHLLYGLHQAKEAIRQSGQVLIVEGYIDVIAMHKHGFLNTVGCMGTSLSEFVVQYLWGIANEIVLIMDNDSAGAKAAERISTNVILPSLKLGKVVKIVDNMHYKDPDEVLRKDPSVMRYFIDNAASLDSFLYQRVKSKVITNIQSAEERGFFKRQLKNLSDSIADKILGAEFYRNFSNFLFWDSTNKKEKQKNDKGHDNANILDALHKLMKYTIYKYPDVLQDKRLEEFLPYFYRNVFVDNALEQDELMQEIEKNIKSKDKKDIGENKTTNELFVLFNCLLGAISNLEDTNVKYELVTDFFLATILVCMIIREQEILEEMTPMANSDEIKYKAYCQKIEYINSLRKIRDEYLTKLERELTFA